MSNFIHALSIVGTASLAGHAVGNGRYGWAVTFGLLFFATLKY